MSSLDYSNDTLTIEISFQDNCSLDLRGRIELLDDTINIRYTDVSQNRKLCNCCYSIQTKIFTKNKISNFKLNGEDIIQTNEMFETFPLEYYIFDTYTLGYIDKYQRSQGIVAIIDTISKSNYKEIHFNNDIKYKEVVKNKKGNILKVKYDFYNPDEEIYEEMNCYIVENRKGKVIYEGYNRDFADKIFSK